MARQQHVPPFLTDSDVRARSPTSRRCRQMLAKPGTYLLTAYAAARRLSASGRHSDRRRPGAAAALMPAGRVLGIDPGTGKAGYAVLEGDGSVLAQGIEPIEGLPARLETVVAEYGPAAIAIGRGTNSGAITRSLAALGLPVHPVTSTKRPASLGGFFSPTTPRRGGAGSFRWACKCPPVRSTTMRQFSLPGGILTNRARAGGQRN